MSSEMDWSHDYCLYCDKQTSEGVYCSQSCRLADLEKAGASEPVSPSYVSGSSYSTSWQSHSASSSNVSHFQLPPALNFNALRSNLGRHQSAPNSPRHAELGVNRSYFSNPSPTSSRTSTSPLQKRSLNASSSRSSLSSISSSSTAQGLSDQALSQLRGYSNSFDQVRDWKRRVTVS